MLETVVLALLFAKIKGYRLKPLIKIWQFYPVIFFLLLYIIIQAFIFAGDYRYVKYSGLFEKLYLISYLLLIFKYRQYISAIIGSSAIIIGTLLNKIAISANGGKMPVFPTLSYITGYYKQGVLNNMEDIHVVGGTSTRLRFLTDIIDVGYSIMSIGDLFIRFFAFIVIYNTIKYINKGEQKYA